MDSFENLPDSVPVKLMIKPVGRWQIPIRANCRYIYFVEVSNNHGAWKPIGMEEAWSSWQEVRAAWPESLGVNPILIKYGQRNFIHFPQKGSHNLVYLRPNLANDRLADVSSKSYDRLDDSQIIFGQLKKVLKKDREMYRKFRSRNPNAHGF